MFFIQRDFYMEYNVYIIYSSTANQYYIGHSANVRDRLFRYNNSGSKATKKANDWKLVYIEIFRTKSEAVKRELEIKKKKSRKYIEWLVNSAG